jgi:transcriptional regulator with PAS, ATPase and Fis domain
MGPTLFAAWQAIARAGRFGSTLHIRGESGVGKESAARAFHTAGAAARGSAVRAPRSDGAGPFVAVNCAAIPQGLAERLLFGAKRGAYSGADSDAEGYVQAANGGTLFLDEVGELDLMVQAKLLRVLESKEVMALGATKAQPVSFRVCSATHKDLRAQVGAGRLREDLYFRLGRPEVRVPALRQRLEEIPFLIDVVVREVDASLAADADLVETCLLRAWPGNVRELLTEINSAAQESLANGKSVVSADQLTEAAGMAFASEPAEPGEARPEPRRKPTRDEIKSVLAKHQGNISRAARALGLHRTQLRRLLERHGLIALGAEAEDPAPATASKEGPTMDAVGQSRAPHSEKD